MSLASQVDALAARVAAYLKASVQPRLMPQGGASGSVLAKTSANDYAAAFTNTLPAGMSFAGRPTFAGQTPYDTGNFNPGLYAPLSGAGFSGQVSAPKVVTVTGADAIVELETTAAPDTTFRRKQIYSSVNVGGGTDWLFRAVRPSDGALRDVFLTSTGTIWTTSNFDPSLKANLGGAAFSGGISAPAVTSPGLVVSGSSGALSFNSRDGAANGQLYNAGNLLRAWNGADFWRLDLTNGNTWQNGSITASGASFSSRPSWAGLTPWDTGNFDPGSKHGTNATVSQDATGGEKHPWEIKRTAAGAVTYQYVTGTNIGVYDTGVGSIWSYDTASNLFDLKGGTAGLRIQQSKHQIQGTTNLKGGYVVTDVAGDTLRIYEDGSPWRGVAVNLAGCGSQSTLWHSGNFNPDGKASLNANVSFNRIAIGENGTGTSLAIGDDAYMGDVNITNTIGVRGMSDAAQGYFAFGTSKSKFGFDGGNWIMNGGGNLFIQPGAGGNYGVWHSGNFDPDSKANLSGAAFWGDVSTSGNSINVARSSDRGGLYMRAGNGTNSGYMEFYRKGTGARDGYIGFSDGTTINLVAEIGSFNFTGNAPKVNGNPIWHSGNFDPNGKASLNGNVSFNDTSVNSLIVAGNLNLPNGWGSNFFYKGPGDGASYSTFNIGLRAWFGLGISTYDGTVTGFFDARAGRWDTKAAPRVNGQDVWWPGNFDPNTKPSTGSVARFAGVSFGNGNPYIYTDNNENIVFRSRHGAADSWRYSTMNADGGWSFNAAISATTVNASGDVITNGRVVVGQGQGASYILMKDSDEGDRYVHNNSGTIGFLNKSGNWVLRSYDDGGLWTSQLGDLNTRIEDRTANRRDEAINTIRGNNNTFSGTLQEIAGTYPTLRLHYRNVKWFDLQTREDGWFHIWGNGEADRAFSVNGVGQVWTRQFGDLNDRIENRTANRRDEAINTVRAGSYFTGNIGTNQQLYIDNANFRIYNSKWGSRHFNVGEDGNLWLGDASNAGTHYFMPDGRIWSKQYGWLSDYVDGRVRAEHTTVKGVRIEGGDPYGGAWPYLSLWHGGVKHWQWAAGNNGYLYARDGDSTAQHLGIGPNGEIWTRQLGDLNNRIEDRASAWARQEGDRGRNEANNNTASNYLPRWNNARVEMNTIPVIAREWPNFELVWGGVLRHQTRLTNTGELQFLNGDNGDVFQAFRTDGSIWTKQFGNLYERIEQRAREWAETRQSQVGTYANASTRKITASGCSIIVGSAVVTCNGDGIAWIAFPWWFAATPEAVIVSNGDAGVGNYHICTRESNQGGFSIQGFYAAGQPTTNVTLRVNYVAMGSN